MCELVRTPAPMHVLTMTSAESRTLVTHRCSTDSNLHIYIIRKLCNDVFITFCRRFIYISLRFYLRSRSNWKGVCVCCIHIHTVMHTHRYSYKYMENMNMYKSVLDTLKYSLRMGVWQDSMKVNDDYLFFASPNCLCIPPNVSPPAPLLFSVV